MKSKLYTFVAILATTLAGVFPVLAQKAGPVTDTIYMGAGYNNEVYYSLSTNYRAAVDHKQWDIAFRTSRMSASILTNDAANNNPIGLLGVELYTYPKSDTSGWATVDTSGLSHWKNMVNSTTDWEEGAFCRNQKGHPDYGWGKYNAASHNVVGDSLFIIRLRDGSYRKLWIKIKYSAQNIYEFRYANLDGSKPSIITLDCAPYESKNFVGFSMITNQAVDFEPVASPAWDLLFARYMYTFPDKSLYLVAGVLSNYKVKVDVHKKVAPNYRLWNVATMDSTRSPIGWDWKTFNGSTYVVEDSLVYFVQDLNKNIHRLVFLDFAGSSTGRIILQKELISAKGVEDFDKSGFNIAVYPNPVRDVLNLIMNPGNSKVALVELFDISGKTLFRQQYNLQVETLSTLRIPVSGIKAGTYVLRVNAGVNVISRKVIIQN